MLTLILGSLAWIGVFVVLGLLAALVDRATR